MAEDLVNKPIVSICIPVYYSGPDTPRVLDKLLTTIDYQDYPYESMQVCLSIQQCATAEYAELTAVMTASRKKKIVHVTPGAEVNSPSTNTNSAMSLAVPGGYTKIMNQDDFFNHHSSITEMVNALEKTQRDWLVSDCIHTDKDGQTRYNLHNASWPGEKGMVEAINQVGCPSVCMFKTDLGVEFDTHPDVCYAMDCDFYIQMARKAGSPVHFQRPDIVVRMWDAQLTNQMNVAQQIEKSKVHMREKYGYK
jgi:hypothetical protein